MTRTNGEEKDVKRDAKGRFVAGTRPVSGGRKKIPEDVKQIFLAAAPDAARMLASMVNDVEVKPEHRIRAAEIILDRAYGKPKQAVDLDTSSIPQVVFIGGDNVAD